jgi:hypothetical protein
MSLIRACSRRVSLSCFGLSARPDRVVVLELYALALIWQKFYARVSGGADLAFVELKTTSVHVRSELVSSDAREPSGY